MKPQQTVKVFLMTTFMIALSGRSAVATINIQGPYRDDLKRATYTNYVTKNGWEISGYTELQPFTQNGPRWNALLPPQKDSDFMKFLSARYDETQWEFTTENSLTGNFFVVDYAACVPGFPCGRIMNARNDAVGAAFALVYEPSGQNAPPVNSSLRWIQWVTETSDDFGTQIFIDNGTNPNPYYSGVSGAITNEQGINQFSFLDIPQRFDDSLNKLPTFKPDIARNHNWLAELYLAVETTSPQDTKRKVTIYDGIRWGWKHTVEKATPPKPTKTFSGTLTGGSQTDKFTLDKLTPGSYFYTWTNNNIPSNRCNPNTYLSATSGNGYNYDDDSSPVGDGFASALSGIVPDNGIIDLFVRATNGGRRGEDFSSYDHYVKVYEGETAPPSIIIGSSGGGLVSRPPIPMKFCDRFIVSS